MTIKNLSLTGKKGNVILDGILVLIVVFVFGIMAFLGYKVMGDLNSDIQADPDISATAKTELDDLNTRYPTFFDNLFIFLLVLLIGFVVVASFVVDTNPLFFIFAIVLIIVLLFVGGSLSNAYEEISTDSELGDASQVMPKTYFVMTHLIETLVIIAFIVLIALYGKSRSDY